jgi:hypothetical protein
VPSSSLPRFETIQQTITLTKIIIVEIASLIGLSSLFIKASGLK